MSNDFSQYDQQQSFDHQPAAPVQPRGSSGCGKGCLILLIILGVLMALFIGGLFWVWNHISQSLTQDPKEIAIRLKQLYPTAQLPPGYTGQLAMKFAIWIELEMMVFATDDADINDDGEVVAGNSMLLFSFKAPGLKQEDLENSMQVGNNGGTVIEKKPYPIRVGEYEFEAYLQRVQRRRAGEERRTYTQVVVNLGDGRMLMMQSDKEKVDEAALREFLHSIAKDCPNAKVIEKVNEKK